MEEYKIIKKELQESLEKIDDVKNDVELIKLLKELKINIDFYLDAVFFGH